MRDVMALLRDADPAPRDGIERVDAAVLAALREDVVRSPVAPADPVLAPRSPRRAPAPGALRRRLGRRGTAVVAVAGILAGGGAAYAAVQALLGPDTAGLTCLTTWSDGALEGRDVDAAGPWLTGDAVADCTALLAAEGLGPVPDPVVFERDGQVYVAPADQVPAWAVPPDDGAGPAAVDRAVVELRQSLADRVDGGNAACRTPDEAEAWARDELERLGLLGWDVERLGATGEARPCAAVSAEVAGTVVVRAAEDPDVLLASPEVDPVVAALRAQVVGQCLTAGQAAAVAEESLAAVPHAPTATVVDGAVCARVDLTIGGSVQVTVRGPADGD